jgi:uncharacterized protein (DUF924 family)
VDHERAFFAVKLAKSEPRVGEANSAFASAEEYGTPVLTTVHSQSPSSRRDDTLSEPAPGRGRAAKETTRAARYGELGRVLVAARSCAGRRARVAFVYPVIELTSCLRASAHTASSPNAFSSTRRAFADAPREFREGASIEAHEITIGGDARRVTVDDRPQPRQRLAQRSARVVPLVPEEGREVAAVVRALSRDEIGEGARAFFERGSSTRPLRSSSSRPSGRISKDFVATRNTSHIDTGTSTHAPHLPLTPRTFAAAREEATVAFDEVLAWWLGPKPKTASEVETKKQLWFNGTAAVDEEIRVRFGELVAKARAGELGSWTETPRGTLALIVLLDQFSRNLYRGTPDAFSHDPICLELAQTGFDSGRFDELDVIERMFAALPFRHAEDIAAQKRGVALAVQDALDTTPLLRDFLVYSVDWARKHLDVIVRFGQFPHRNRALGRTSTPEEIDYLAYLELTGQWL